MKQANVPLVEPDNAGESSASDLGWSLFTDELRWRLGVLALVEALRREKLTIRAIERITGVSWTSVWRWHRALQTVGMAALVPRPSRNQTLFAKLGVTLELVDAAARAWNDGLDPEAAWRTVGAMQTCPEGLRRFLNAEPLRLPRSFVAAVKARAFWRAGSVRREVMRARVRARLRRLGKAEAEE